MHQTILNDPNITILQLLHRFFFLCCCWVLMLLTVATSLHTLCLTAGPDNQYTPRFLVLLGPVPYVYIHISPTAWIRNMNVHPNQWLQSLDLQLFICERNVIDKSGSLLTNL